MLYSTGHLRTTILPLVNYFSSFIFFEIDFKCLPFLICTCNTVYAMPCCSSCRTSASRAKCFTILYRKGSTNTRYSLFDFPWKLLPEAHGISAAISTSALCTNDIFSTCKHCWGFPWYFQSLYQIICAWEPVWKRLSSPFNSRGTWPLLNVSQKNPWTFSKFLSYSLTIYFRGNSTPTAQPTAQQKCILNFLLSSH